ncbi:MAG: hypothetical protein SOT89_03285 [Clostridiaceae bacterium]|nr:hypothetical protein [Clostridiaceae bacterium]
MSGEADEAGGLTPVHEENEAGRGFRPEKPYLPLSIEGKNACKKQQERIFLKSWKRLLCPEEAFYFPEKIDYKSD